MGVAEDKVASEFSPSNVTCDGGLGSTGGVSGSPFCGPVMLRDKH